MIGIQARNTRKSDRGAVLLEAMWVFLPAWLSLFLFVDLFRLGLMHLAVEQAAFIYVRERAMGANQYEAQILAQNFIHSLWRTPYRIPVQFEETRTSRYWLGKVHIRFPQLLRFRIGGGSKHHFEVTKLCQFPGV